MCFDFDKHSRPYCLPAFQVEKTSESVHVGVVEKVRRALIAMAKATRILTQLTRPIRLGKSGKRMVQQEINLRSTKVNRGWRTRNSPANPVLAGHVSWSYLVFLKFVSKLRLISNIAVV
jgi:hypothetical protein